MTSCSLRVSAALSLPLIGSSLLTGCTLKTTAAPGPSPAVAISGRVFGGQNPVVNAKVYLLAADETGYGKPSDSLLNPVLTGNPADSIGSYVVSQADGSFALNTYTGGDVPVYDYVCPTSTTQVYVYISGGDSGAGTPNDHIGLMAALGSCGNLSDTTFIEVNEVTTVAAAYALSGFATDAVDISSAARPLAITGLQNAFLNAAQLANTTFGTANATTPNGNGTVDQQQIYTLANILASCVNTDGTESGPTNPTACYTLMNNATTGGTSPVVPGDTATAAINIAHHAGANVATLAALSTKTSPFPQAATPPTDLSVGINFNASFMDPFDITEGEGGIAIDAEGNAWFGYIFDSAGIGKFSSTGVLAPGAPFTGSGTLGAPGGLAIDQLGSLWVADVFNTQVVEFSSDGTTATVPTAGAGLAAANLVIDAAGNVWVDNANSSTNLPQMTKMDSPTFATSSTYTAGFGSSVELTGLAFDASGNLWAGEFGGVAELKPNGSPYTGSPYSLANGSPGAEGVAVDANGAVWVDSRDQDSFPDLIKLTGSGASDTSVEYTGGGLGSGEAVAIDGAGNIWVANSDSPESAPPVAEFSNAGVSLSPAGFSGGQAGGCAGIAVDGSGDVWVTNSTGSGTTVSELIGAAVPVVTPISAGLVAPYTPGSMP